LYQVICAISVVPRNIPDMGMKKTATPATPVANTAGHSRFGDNLRAERERRGWSLARLATELEAFGVKMYASGLHKTELGEREVKAVEIVALAQLFGTTTDVLLGLRQATERTREMEIRTLVDRIDAAAISGIHVVMEVSILAKAFEKLEPLSPAENRLRESLTAAAQTLSDAHKSLSRLDGMSEVKKQLKGAI
jgi:transcriptional regulator with XRE-family HTH domain